MMSPQLLRSISRYQLIMVAVFSAASLVFWLEAAPGVLAGGLVMAGNFWVMRRALEKLTDAGAANRTKVLYGLFLVTKFFLVMGALALMVLVLRLDALGIALGMLSLFVGIGLGVAHHALRRAPAA
jgi:hypothetical protein